MTDKEIVKALRCCADRYCKGCSEHEKANCKETISALAWDLITRQQAEIEHLEAENKLLINRNCELAEKGEKAIVTFVKSQNQLKSEARREFAEKIHKHCTSIELNEYIDTLVEEMERDIE